METNVDFIATHIRRGERITQVGSVRVLGRGESGDFEDRDLMERAELLELVREGRGVFAWDYQEDGLGAAIEIVAVQGEEYLRLDGAKLAADNLGSLPEV